MAKIELLVPKLLKWEGGFVNNPKDKGGATNKGITFSTYKDYCKKNGKPEPSINDLKNISNDEWCDIVTSGYWNKMKADEINNQSIANIMVDWLINSGLSRIKNIQKIVGITPDGIVGAKTLTAINHYPDQEDLFDKVWNARKIFYNNIVRKNPSQKVFLKGWMNRLNDYKFEK